MLEGYASAVCRVERDAAVGAAADARAADADEGYDEADLLKPEGNSSSSCALAELLSHADAERAQPRPRSRRAFAPPSRPTSAVRRRPTRPRASCALRGGRRALEAVLASAPWGGGSGGGGVGGGGGGGGGDGAAGVLEREAREATPPPRGGGGSARAGRRLAGRAQRRACRRHGACRRRARGGGRRRQAAAPRRAPREGGAAPAADAPSALGFCAAVLRRGGGAAAALLGHGAWADVERAWFCAMAADALGPFGRRASSRPAKRSSPPSPPSRAPPPSGGRARAASGAAAAESLFLPSCTPVPAAAVPARLAAKAAAATRCSDGGRPC